MTGYDEAVPAGRDLTANDLWGVLEHFSTEEHRQWIADYLNRIARPSPRSWSLPAPPPDDVTRSDDGTDLRELRIHVCENCIARKPGTCHVPGCFYIRHTADEVPTYLHAYAAAPQDHAAAVRLARAARASLDYTSTDAGRTRLRHDLDRAARVFETKPSVVEGEPQAAEQDAAEPTFAVGDWVRTLTGRTGTVGKVSDNPLYRVHFDNGTLAWYRAENLDPAPEPPRFERGFYRLARDLDDGTGVIPAHTEIVVHGPFEDGVWVAVVGGINAGQVSAAALAAAGAVRVEEE